MDSNALMDRLFRASDLPSKDMSRTWHYTAAPSLTSFRSNELTGKWCIFRDPGDVDGAWDIIKQLAETEQILCAKVSTAVGRIRHPDHVICVYTRDASNLPDVLASRGVLRAAGFSEELGYKRDIDTARRVYGADEWMLRA